jgi:hypothetical protein
VSLPQATPTTASAIKSADAFLNLMVLPFVGIFGFSPSVDEWGQAKWLPPTATDSTTRVWNRAGTLTGRGSTDK